MSDNHGKHLSQGANLEYTGERHIPAQLGVELLPMANLEHMIRYAFVAPFVQGKRVLDISCGSGYGTQYIALQGAAELVGVDVDQPSLEYARRYHHHPAITYLQSDAHSVSVLESSSFDLIVSFETIEHLQKPRDFLLELRRLLKPDGQLFISCPNDYRVSPWVSKFHLHKFRFEEFRDLIVNTFGEAQFLGQHHAIASCIVSPVAASEKVYQFGAYRQIKLGESLIRCYVEHLSAIESADAYLGVVGVEANAISNSLSISQQAFQSLMGYYKALADKEQESQKSAATRDQESQAVTSTLQSQQLSINTLQEKIKLLEERNGKLLREGAVLGDLQAELESKQRELEHAHNRIVAMESSKFWSLRKDWFKVKRRLNLPGDE